MPARVAWGGAGAAGAAAGVCLGGGGPRPRRRARTPKLHLSRSAREPAAGRARAGIRGAGFAAVRASALPRADSCGEVSRPRHPLELASSEGHPASLARHAEVPAWAVPATWGDRSPQSPRLTPPLSPPSLSFTPCLCASSCFLSVSGRVLCQLKE